MGSGASRALQQMALSAPPCPVYATGPDVSQHEMDILLDEAFWDSTGQYLIKDSRDTPLFKVADVREGFRAGPLVYDLDGDLVLSVREGADGYTRYELHPANGMAGISTFRLIPEKVNYSTELLCSIDNSTSTTYFKMLTDGIHSYIFCGDPKNANMVAKLLTASRPSSAEVPGNAHRAQLLKIAPMVDVGLMVALVLCYDKLVPKLPNLSRSNSKTSTRAGRGNSFLSSKGSVAR